MRTLKKTLCLVLALAMILGLGAFSVSATELKDDADVGTDYREAVEVLTTVGALKGDDKGNLNPKNEMTRAEAAIMIARLSKISEEAGIAPFDDCTDYNSFAGGAIAYCYYQGLINGDGNGNFMPGEPLTGYAFEKMLLCSLGYDAQIESLTNVGETWTIATAALAKKAGISWASLDGSKNLTREVAAKLVLNALKANKVTYANRGVTINNADGSSVRVANTAAQADVPTNRPDYIGAIKNDTILQLGEDLYTGDLKLASANEKDAFGRPASKWTYKNKEIITAASSPAVTFTASTSAADVATALSGYKVYAANYTKTDNTNGTGAYVSIDNSTNYTALVIHKDSGSTDILSRTSSNDGAINISVANTVKTAGTQTIANVIAGYTGNGTLVEIYANSSNEVTKIVQVEYTVEKVSAINTNTAGDVTYSFSVSGTKTDFVNGDDTVILHGTIAKDDYVTTTKGYGSNVLHVYPTTVVTGQQTSISGSKITISGSNYTLGTGVKLSTGYVKADDFTNSTTDANYYIDQYGYVVGHGTLSTTKNYAAVLAIKGTDNTDSVSNSKNTVSARLALSDGSVVNVTVSKINGQSVSSHVKKSTSTAPVTNDDITSDKQTTFTVSTATEKYTDGTNHLAGRVVTYTQTSDGYELVYGQDSEKYVSLTSAMTELITKGYAEIGRNTSTGTAGTANAATVYVVATSDNDETIKAYTGFSNVPTIKGKGTGTIYARWIENENSKRAEFVFVNAFAGESSDKSTGNVLYMFSNNNGITTSGTGSDALYTLRGVLNGELNEAITCTSKSFGLSSGEPSGGNFYKVDLDKTNNRVQTSGGTKAEWSDSGIVTGVNLDEIADSVFASHVVTSSTKIYVITDSSSTQSVEKAESLSAAGISIGDSFQLDLKSSSNEIDVLYIVKGATNGAVEIASDSTDASANAKTLQDAVDTGNVVYSTGTIQTDDFTVTKGKTLTVQATELIVSSGEAIDVQGTLNVYGDLKGTNTSVIKVEDGATLNVYGNNVSAHIDAAPGSTVNFISSSDLTISGNSLVVTGGATATINAGTHNVNITGLVKAYTVSTDTGAAKIDITAGNVNITEAGSLQAVYFVGKDAQIVINGNLTVDTSVSGSTDDGAGYGYSVYLSGENESGASLVVHGKLIIYSNVAAMVKVDNALFTADSVYESADSSSESTDNIGVLNISSESPRKITTTTT